MGTEKIGTITEARVIPSFPSQEEHARNTATPVTAIIAASSENFGRRVLLLAVEVDSGRLMNAFGID